MGYILTTQSCQTVPKIEIVKIYVPVYPTKVTKPIKPSLEKVQFTALKMDGATGYAIDRKNAESLFRNTTSQASYIEQLENCIEYYERQIDKGYLPEGVKK